MTDIKVGETYTSLGGGYECLFIRGDLAWLAYGGTGTAYRWNKISGRCIDLGEKYNIDLTPKPKRETVEYVGHWDSMDNDFYDCAPDGDLCHNVKLTWDTLDEVPQWDTLKGVAV